MLLDHGQQLERHAALPLGAAAYFCRVDAPLMMEWE